MNNIFKRESNPAKTLRKILKTYGLSIEIVNAFYGPTYNRFEIRPTKGTRIKHIENILTELEIFMHADGVRLVYPIPGKDYIVLEMGRKDRETVLFEDVDLSSLSGSPAAFLAGIDAAGNVVHDDLRNCGPILVQGLSGSGKTVFAQNIIKSITENASPQDIKFAVIDLKNEYSFLDGSPFLLGAITTDYSDAVNTIMFFSEEASRRANLIKKAGVGDFLEYNALDNVKDTAGLQEIVLIIDSIWPIFGEYDEEAVNSDIHRLAILERTTGIHLLLIDQFHTPGFIRASMHSSACFPYSVECGIKDTDKLLGNGDFLYKTGLSEPVRLQVPAPLNLNSRIC
ncbi:MAG: hypothetical protein HUJ75_06835 [Parasporobacterium sp.]|nr:hypothetical protein [Parasporobacterium sp.]